MTTTSLALYGHRAAEHLPIARHAEQLGFDGVWVGEHVLASEAQSHVDPHRPNSPPVVGPSTDLYDVWTLVGALLATTERIFVATGIYIAPLRHPLSTALSAITAAKIGGGRFRLGIGAGWLAEEFETLGADFDSRFRRIPEIVEILRRASAGGYEDFDGEHYRYGRLRLTDEPVPVPVVMGGVTPAALRRAARLADGWYNPGLVDLDACARIRDEIEARRQELGRSDRPFTYYIRMVASGEPVDPDRYRAAGFDDLVVPWESLWDAEERRSLAVPDKLARLASLAERLGLVSS